MREELALKAAILAEKFAPDLSWLGLSLFFHCLYATKHFMAWILGELVS